MIKFLIKGLWRDKSRSLMPVLVVAIGVMLTVFMHAYVNGFMGDTIEMNARFSDGHAKITSRAYASEAELRPVDLALLHTAQQTAQWQAGFPNLRFVHRIPFGGLIDVADEKGETRSQGPAAGFGIDILNPAAGEAQRLNIPSSIIRGVMPANHGEALLSDAFAQKLMIQPGETFTLIGSDFYGSMVLYNFILSGTVSFGVETMDRGTVIADINDVRQMLNMPDASSEILVFFDEGYYDDSRAKEVSDAFNNQFADESAPYSPLMKPLSALGNMGQYVAMAEVWSWYIALIFIFAMSLVLWNAGLLGGLRRYGEIGVRLAMGEPKGHVYKTMLVESLFVGLVGSIAGTAIGLFFAYLLQTYGFDISGMMDGASMMMPSVIRARITMVDFYLGFIPGLLSTLVGTMLAGIGIFKRQTASLFKELEA